MRLPNYGIENADMDNIRGILGAGRDDAFVIFAAPKEKIGVIADQIVSRVRHIADAGIPADTRLATPAGETRFLRPRPGAARMYPETDVPPVIISDGEMDDAKRSVPEPMGRVGQGAAVKVRHQPQLSEQLFDSRYAELFERIVESAGVSPTFVASVLCYSITNLERGGLDSALLKDEEAVKTFEFLQAGRIAKESVEMIFGSIMAGRSSSVEEAMKEASIEDPGRVGSKEDDPGGRGQQHAAGQQPGREGDRTTHGNSHEGKLRGKASGEAVNRILRQCIQSRIR